MSKYNTGTVTVTSGSAVVTGSGTSWSGNVTAGSVFTIVGSGVPYVVGSVDSNTQITLTSNYAAGTASGQSYSLTTSFTPNRKLPYMEEGDIDPHTTHKRSMLQLDTLLGTAFSANRVIYTDGSGNLTNGSGLTYNGSIFSVSGAFSATGLTLNSSGNLGLGVSPSAWYSGYKAMQIAAQGSIASDDTANGALEISNNVFRDSGATRTFIGSYSAAQYMQYRGEHRFYTSTDVSPTAGNAITFLQAFTVSANGHLLPGADNTQTIGNGSYRWSVVYAGTGTINTSDARQKTDLRLLSDAERTAALELKAAIGVFQFLEAVAAKGADKARLHVGMTVQHAIVIMESHGLDPTRYGFICYDRWDEEAIDHPAVEAADAQPAQPAEYETRVIEERAVVDGKPVTLRHERLVCIKEAVPEKPAIEAKDAWREVIRPAGEIYGFRMDELLAFIIAAL